MKNFFVRRAWSAALLGLQFLSFPLFTHAQILPKQSQPAEPEVVGTAFGTFSYLETGNEEEET